MSKETATKTVENINIIQQLGTENRSIVPKSETDAIYRSGHVSPETQSQFRTLLDRNLSNQGMNMDTFIERNRQIKIQMKEYLDSYKVQRSLMEVVIYYLRHPEYAGVRLMDKVGGMFGKNLQLEAKKIAADPHSIRKLFEDMVYSIEKSRGKTAELEKHAVALYSASMNQRDNVEKDITILLQKISLNKDVITKREDVYNKIKTDMDTLIEFMRTELGMTVRGNKPVFDEIDSVSSIDAITKGINDLTPEVSEKPAETGTNINTVKDEKETTNNETGNATDPRIIEKKKIEAIKTYHAVNDKLVKAENSLRDAKNEKLVLHQNYERAKENLTLYERVLINQVNEARNYFALLYAIYDAEVKYTLPSARLIAHMASLQEVAIHLAKQIYDSRNIFNSLLDSVTQGALDIQEGIILLAVTPSWSAKVIEQSEIRTVELTKRTNLFIGEMNRRLTEIETNYGTGEMKKIHDKADMDNGLDNNYLQRLLEK